MVPLVVTINVIASLTLILFILLHAGRGGGLSDMFGGGMSTSLGGSTVVERNLDRLTVGAAVVYGLSSVILAILLAPS
jgi:preprotein translocase subunit SecG